MFFSSWRHNARLQDRADDDLGGASVRTIHLLIASHIYFPDSVSFSLPHAPALCTYLGSGINCADLQHSA